MKYQQGVDRDWVSHIARPARYFFQFGIPSPAIARMLVDVASKIGLSIRKKFEGDAEKQAILLSSLHKLTFYEMEIVLSEITQRSEEHTSELQSLMRTSYAVFCLKKKTIHNYPHHQHSTLPTPKQHNNS